MKPSAKIIAPIQRLVVFTTAVVVTVGCAVFQPDPLPEFGAPADSSGRGVLDIELRQTFMSGVHFERYRLIGGEVVAECGLTAQRRPNGSLVKLKSPRVIAARAVPLSEDCQAELERTALRLARLSGRGLAGPQIGARLLSRGQFRLRVVDFPQIGRDVSLATDVKGLVLAETAAARSLRRLVDLLRATAAGFCRWEDFGGLQLLQAASSSGCRRD